MIIFYFFSIVGRKKAILPSCAIISRLKEWVGGGESSPVATEHDILWIFKMRTRGQQEWFDCIQNQINIAVSIQMKCSFPNWHCSFYRFFFRVAFAVVLQLFWQPYIYWVTWYICTLTFKWGRGDRAAQKWGSIIQMARGVRIESCRLFSIVLLGRSDWSKEANLLRALSARLLHGT